MCHESNDNSWLQYNLWMESWVYHELEVVNRPYYTVSGLRHVEGVTMRSSFKTSVSLLGVLALLVSGLALADTAQVQAKNLARFEKYAGKSVDTITVFQQQGWQPLGPQHLALWTGVNRVYLIKVAKPCIRLEWANGVGITPHMNRLRARFDVVHVEGQSCEILSMRPVDYRAMRKSFKAAGTSMLKPKAMASQSVPSSESRRGSE